MAAQTNEEGLAQWRVSFLAAMLRYALICGAVVSVPSIYAALRNGIPSVVVIDLLALGWLFGLGRLPLPYAVRAWSFVGLIYVLGSWFLLTVGVVSLIYLTAFPVMASVLLGLRASVLALVINGITLMAVGYLAGFNLPLTGPGDNALLKWSIITLNFLFVNSIITTASALMLQRLDAALKRQQAVNEELLHEVQERQRAEEEVRRLNVGLEERVRERTHQLQEANREMEAYSYSVSHDLRGPLSSINGFIHILEKAWGDNPPPQARHGLNRIRANVGRMGDLIEALLSLAQLSRVPVRSMPVDLGALAQEILAACAETEPARQVRVDIRHPLMVEGDPRLLRAMLQNLLGNAWKFTGRQAAPEITVGVETGAAGEPVYFVRDNGAGFDMAYADKLFGTFQRLHAAEDFPGTGIGLATVRRIVTLHGGKVWAESTVGAGSTFFFTLGRLPAEV